MLRVRVNSDIVLKQVILADARAIFDAIDTEREYLGKWLPFVDQTVELADSENFIKSIYLEVEDRRELVFVISYEDAFAGLIGFKALDRANKKTEIGYWLSKKYQKRGIVTESVKTLIGYAFNDLDVNRIQIRCGVGNLPSSGIPKRLGFVLEGVERDGELLPSRGFIDLEVYSLLKKDFVE